MWEGKCISKCPSGTYASEDDTCSLCDPSCELCTEESDCSKCNEGFYLNDNTCLEVCPEDKYPEINSRTCQPCNSACLGCYGPFVSDCKQCNSEQSYSKSSEGKCTLTQCPTGTYLSLIGKSINCLQCNSTCSSCDGPGSCLECKDGLISVQENNGTICKTCEDIDSGYYTDNNGRCKGNPKDNSRNMWRRYQLRTSRMRRRKSTKWRWL